MAPERRPRAGSAAERRRRKGRVLLGASVVLSALALTAWFPAGALLQQRSALAKTNSSLNHLRQQDHALSNEKALLKRPNEVSRIARQDYGLVGPGQRSYEVLPRSASGANSYAGDPGQQPLAPPNAGAIPGGSAAANGGSSGAGSHQDSSASSGSHRSAGSGSSTSSPPNGVWGRIVNTLEFWR